jgi:hypothetical protein
MTILAPISAGEMVDKITILRVKAERIGDPTKLANVVKELGLLEAIAADALPISASLVAMTSQLTAVNAALWDIEDAIRDCERRQDFGAEFVRLARAVYFENDRRAAIKRAINHETGSELVEEKSYRSYGPD